ncbi:MAG: hypothetical protein P1P65_03355 [Treponema sp.]
MYNFENDASPKEIIVCAMMEIAEFMKSDGFHFIKSKLEIRKVFDFMVCISAQMNRHNKRGVSAEALLICSINDKRGKECFWSKGLAVSNKKEDSLRWRKFCGIESYEQSMNEIKKILSERFLPFIRRMEYEPTEMIQKVAEKGFCIFADEPVYDAGFHVPTNFLLKYGTHEQLTMAFQNYIDKHQLHFVKPNMEKAIALLKENKEVINNGEKDYAEFIIKHNIELKF